MKWIFCSCLSRQSLQQNVFLHFRQRNCKSYVIQLPMFILESLLITNLSVSDLKEATHVYRRTANICAWNTAILRIYQLLINALSRWHYEQNLRNDSVACLIKIKSFKNNFGMNLLLNWLLVIYCNISHLFPTTFYSFQSLHTFKLFPTIQINIF